MRSPRKRVNFRHRVLLLGILASGCNNYSSPNFDGPGNKPLVLGWVGADRVEIELAAANGPVIVSSRSGTGTVLGGCTVTGSYSYKYTPSKHVERDTYLFKSKQELRAWIPFGYGQIVQGMSNEQSVGIAMVTAGVSRLKDSADRNAGDIYYDDLKGQSLCDEATHYVSAIYIGAFRISTVQSDTDKTSFENSVFGVSVENTVEYKMIKEEGSFAACKGGQFAANLFSRSDGAQPISRCDYSLRIELTKLKGGSRSESHASQKQKSPVAPPSPRRRVTLPPRAKAGQATADNQSQRWWCLCYSAWIKHAPGQALQTRPNTTCRKDLKKCSYLEGVASSSEGGRRIKGNSLIRSCTNVTGPFPWSSLGHRDKWDESSLPGNWQLPGECVLP